MTSQNKVKSIFNFIRYRVILCFYNKTVLQAEQDIDQIVPAVISIFPAGTVWCKATLLSATVSNTMATA